MIYIICFTQLVTVGAVLVGVRWGLQYLEHQEEEARNLIGISMQQMKDAIASSQEAIGGVVESSHTQVQRILNQSYRDREMLCERIQHPEYMKAQAPSADKGDKSQPHTMDETREFELENPEAVTQEIPVEASIPGARSENDEIVPVPAVQPFGKGRSNGSTE